MAFLLQCTRYLLIFMCTILTIFYHDKKNLLSSSVPLKPLSKPLGKWLVLASYFFVFSILFVCMGKNHAPKDPEKQKNQTLEPSENLIKRIKKGKAV
jgi:hypothetical protein